MIASSDVTGRTVPRTHEREQRRWCLWPVALAGLAGVWGCGLVAEGDGPLEIIGGADHATGIGAAVGQEVSYGSSRLGNTGDAAATISSVGLIDFHGPAEAAKVVEAGIYPIVDGAVLAAGYWPEEEKWPAEGLLPAEGYLLEPGEEVSMFFVVEGTVEGSYGWRGVEVEYEVDGRGYREEQANAFVLCIPPDSECDLRSTLGME